MFERVQPNRRRFLASGRVATRTPRQGDAQGAGRARRFVKGRYEPFSEFAADLVRAEIDSFVSGTSAAVQPMCEGTSGIPVRMGYSVDSIGSGLAAHFVDRVFHGANLADLPIEQPTSFHLAVNLQSVKQLGLSIPETILQCADEVVR